MLHQFTFINKCSIHNIELRYTCPICRERLPYIIEFRDKAKGFSCNHCGNNLNRNDNFGELVDYWIGNSNENYTLENFKLNEIPIIISNYIDQNITDNEINNFLYSLYDKKSNEINAKYIISKGMTWSDIDFGSVITPNLGNKRKIEEYVYIYAYQKLYRHLSRTLHVRNKLHKAEEYIRYCCPYHKILSNTQIDRFYKHFNLDAVTLFLWKRDMEYSSYSKYAYYMNKQNQYNYKFDPDHEILDYIKKISDMLSDIIDESYKFSILVHIATTLMSDKYKEWIKLTKYLYQHNDKYEFTKVLNNITLRKYSDKYNKEFLLTINQTDHIYKLYFSPYTETY